MGFPYHAIKIPTSIISILSIINPWSNLKFIILGVVCYLGIYKPNVPEEEDDSATHTLNDHIYILDGPCPSLVPIPIHVVTAAVKTLVPILVYSEFLLKEKEAAAGEGDFGEEIKEEVRCSICMEGIEERDEVRDLIRCNHVFHRDCLDTWIDSGHVSCPLCRSMLLPPNTNPYRIALHLPRKQQPNSSVS